MTETQRFLRFVTPGLTFAIQTLLLLGILMPSFVWQQISALKSDSGIGVAVTLFLASGGLGFLFSVIHHELHSFDFCSAVDHRQLLRRLDAAQLLRIETLDSGHFQAADLSEISRSDAWDIVTVLWRERLLEGGGIQAAEPGT